MSRSSGGSFWTGPFLIGLALLLGVGLGVVFYYLEGWPGDHDAYGEVAVPGAAVLSLPADQVRLNFENHATQSGDSTSVDDQPDGLAVTILPVGGGEPVKVDDVPSWLFSSTTNDRGHEPWGKADIPEAGDYLVRATSDDAPKSPPPATNTAAADPPKIDDGAAISVGKKPWAPFGSRIFGAIVVCVLVFGLMFLFSLPFRLFRSS